MYGADAAFFALMQDTQSTGRLYIVFISLKPWVIVQQGRGVGMVIMQYNLIIANT